MTVSRYKATRFWAVFDAAGALVCVCVYKKGADEVVRRLTPAVIPDPFWDPRFVFLSATATGAQFGGKENVRP